MRSELAGPAQVFLLHRQHREDEGFHLRRSGLTFTGGQLQRAQVQPP
ncbi:hypothetical protein [Streptomyces yangpuensis]